MLSIDTRRILPAMSDETSLLAANAAYYRAFIEGDIDRMSALWGEDDVACIHPGWPPLFGREAVLASYRDILRNPMQEPIVRRNERALIAGAEGRVICVEVVGGAALVATNWFRFAGGAWRLVHHQASPLAIGAPEPPPQERPRSLH
ncbi:MULTISPECIES: nuclear transport factor 2 family protein [Methylosinus]|uniref:nuclear transport factor 2 family protein n=1 Tax=Methylosinus TaxID=425 RepID=UPI0002E2B666